MAGSGRFKGFSGRWIWQSEPDTGLFLAYRSTGPGGIRFIGSRGSMGKRQASICDFTNLYFHILRYIVVYGRSNQRQDEVRDKGTSG